MCKSHFCTLFFKYCCHYCLFLIPWLFVVSKLSHPRVSVFVPMSPEGNRGRGAAYLEFKLKSLKENVQRKQEDEIDTDTSMRKLL